jgi:hypothetical protein
MTLSMRRMDGRPRGMSKTAAKKVRVRSPARSKKQYADSLLLGIEPLGRFAPSWVTMGQLVI